MPRLTGVRSGHDGGSDVTISDPQRSAAGVVAVAVSLRRTVAQLGVTDTARTLKAINQTDGFDCPGCAWPERQNRHIIEFCENGAKAVADQAAHARCTPQFFARHSIEELAAQDDYWLGQTGRLTHPMIRRAGASHYEPVEWDEALTIVADELRALRSPDEAIFYTSGRTSNEAAFAYQLLARAYGTNNLPDCSNMCHEPTSVALTDAIGIGKGSVTFEDFDVADLVIVVGQNPGTNHPRMLTTLEEVKRRGAHIIAVNPLPEAGLLRFKNPQRASGIIGHGTTLADIHLPVRLGGDQALFRWLTRRVIEANAVDRDFVDHYTEGFDAFREALLQDPVDLCADIGVADEALQATWQMVRSARRIIICWAMGITQHRDSVATIRDLVNFALVTGSIGRPGAGLSPIRGHSNVQGDRTMGVWSTPETVLLDAISDTFGFDPPRSAGLDSVESLEALRDGKARVVVSMGGNLARSLPDTETAERALTDCRLTVHISTKLNRSHLVPGELSMILPTLARTDIDRQASGPQFVTIEDSFGTVHRSIGRLQPASTHLRSEVSIVAGIARRLVSNCGVQWDDYESDYRTIRSDIARVIPGFERFEERVLQPGGFLLPHPPRDRRQFPTPSATARFSVEALHPPYHHPGGLVLQSLRSHDQFNTTIYGLDDRYRGVTGGRRVVFINADDLDRLGLRAGSLVDIVAGSAECERVARAFRVVCYPTPPGCAAVYYPEANVLTHIDNRSTAAGTPSYKSIPVTLRAPGDSEVREA